jgi:hypothetical protein
MDVEVRQDASVDELLRAFFAAQGERLRGRGLERLREAERLFRRCLEGRIEQLLPLSERTILRAEREFAPRSAGARLATPRMILQVLPTFLETWHGAEPDERSMQLTVAQRLLELVSSLLPPDDDTAELRMAVRIALRRARRRFQLAKIETRWQERLRRTAG